MLLTLATSMSLADREDRLTAICNVLGHPSLTSLEDFIFLHGSNFKLTPTTPPSASQDTQTQLPLQPALTDSLQQTNLSLLDKARARKHDLRRVRGELERAGVQIGFLEGERRREVGRREEVERDWRRVEERNRELVAERGRERERGEVAEAGAREEVEAGQAARFAQHVDQLNQELDQVRAQLSAAEADKVCRSEELNPLRDDNATLQNQVSNLELNLDAANQSIEQLNTDMAAFQQEFARLDSAVEQLDDDCSRAVTSLDAERDKREQAEVREEHEREGRRVAERDNARLRAVLGEEAAAGPPGG